MVQKLTVWFIDKVALTSSSRSQQLFAGRLQSRVWLDDVVRSISVFQGARLRTYHGVPVSQHLSPAPSGRHARAPPAQRWCAKTSATVLGLRASLSSRIACRSPSVRQVRVDPTSLVPTISKLLNKNRQPPTQFSRASRRSSFLYGGFRHNTGTMVCDNHRFLDI